MSQSPSPNSCSLATPRRRAVWRRLPIPLLIGVSLIVIGVWVYHSRAPRTFTMQMLVDVDPNRALVAERLAREAKRYGVGEGLMVGILSLVNDTRTSLAHAHGVRDEPAAGRPGED
jgi:hypothetical protein